MLPSFGSTFLLEHITMTIYSQVICDYFHVATRELNCVCGRQRGRHNIKYLLTGLLWQIWKIPAIFILWQPGGNYCWSFSSLAATLVSISLPSLPSGLVCAIVQSTWRQGHQVNLCLTMLWWYFYRCCFYVPTFTGVHDHNSHCQVSSQSSHPGCAS